ncbi:HAD domain-containing protein [Variovorax sp. J22G73]|uniref:HAD domain-containing protein n=1 Tax=unclassified Variovorax TaxID=663243 RepID=UPI002576D671|nr:MULTISPECIES: HAD domain-containing protein [unclassified Variovorax]MDM0007470.1 HAD domain-containing protein [Variovorax sp. J22R203]MDM0100170.1 HAD domain-containing protein [Variovorax sp. J22G73]
MTEATPTHDAVGRTGDSSDLLFLDIDGVLHPVGVDYSFSSRFFSHLPLLEELLREFKSVNVVISSDWRRAESIEQLQRYFSDDIRHRIIGATPQIDPNAAVHHRRQLEIQAWLDGNGRSDAEWVALDDWPSSFEPGFARLVLTDSKQAFDQDRLQELRSHFLRFTAGRCFVSASTCMK